MSDLSAIQKLHHYPPCALFEIAAAHARIEPAKHSGTDVNSTPLPEISNPEPQLAYLLSQYPAVSHTFLRDEIAGMRERGFTVHIASINPPSRSRPLTPEEQAEASTTRYIKSTPKLKALGFAFKMLFTSPLIFFRGLFAALRGTGIDLYRNVYALFYFVEALLLGEWMHQKNLRHLHIHFGGAVATVGSIAAQAWKFSYSLTIHGPDEFFNQNEFRLQEKIRSASFILCVSDYTRSQLMRISPPEHWDKMHIARLGVDPARFPARKPRRIAIPVQIVCIGRLVPDKGQLVLLQACKEVLKRGQSLLLTIAGDGPDAAMLKNFVSDNQMQDVVHFSGALTHDQAQQLLSEVDVFALASFAEGIPVALMEAMSVQLAVVATHVCGIPELITNDVEGLLVAPSSVEQLADALEKLIVDPELRGRLGLEARKRIVAEYKQRRSLDRLAKFFSKQAVITEPQEA